MQFVSISFDASVRTSDDRLVCYLGAMAVSVRVRGGVRKGHNEPIFHQDVVLSKKRFHSTESKAPARCFG